MRHLQDKILTYGEFSLLYCRNVHQTCLLYQHDQTKSSCDIPLCQFDNSRLPLVLLDNLLHPNRNDAHPINIESSLQRIRLKAN